MSRSFACAGFAANQIISANNTKTNRVRYLSNIIVFGQCQFHFVHLQVDNLCIQSLIVAC